MKIDKGIPMPGARSGHGQTSMTLTALKMDLGDSILFDVPSKAETFAGALRRHKRKGAIRKTPEGWRLWRTE